MTALKYVTGLFAIFMLMLFPVKIKVADICEDSVDRVEAYVSSFADEVSAEKKIDMAGVEKLAGLLAVEPDIFDLRITVAIKHLVPGGGSYSVGIDHDEITDILEREGQLSLSEGDSLYIDVSVVEPSVFSRMAGRYKNERERKAGKISIGRRIRWEKLR
ncbi:MAG: hypothetical protein K6F93_06325 [Lachnospiraceae bacterium]|nr:hypothetical protein [Lachnospiraceae bacterium]